MAEYSHAFRNAVILHLFHHIMYKSITFRKPTLLPSSGERDRQTHLLWRTHQKQLASVTGPSRRLSWPKYVPETKSLYSLMCVRSALSTGSPEKLHFPYLFVWGRKHLQRIFVVVYRRFRTTYRPHFQCSRRPMTSEYETDGLPWKFGKLLSKYITLQSRRAKTSSTMRRKPEFSFLLLTAYLARFFFLLWRCDPTQFMASSFLRFLDHTQRRTTVGRTPLDEWSARRRDLARLHS